MEAPYLCEKEEAYVGRIKTGRAFRRFGTEWL